MQVASITMFWMQFVGVFILVYVLLTIKEPIAIGIVVAGLMYFAHSFPNGAFNPAGTIAEYLSGEITSENFVWIIVAQVLGAFAAYYFYKIMKTESGD
jgi:glycerol uptake facilitator-like aquaporin